jgi:hypothetical protein
MECKSILAVISCAAIWGVLWFGSAMAADIVYSETNIDPIPIVSQKPAVDGVNFKASAITGAIGGYTNNMFILSAATPMPYMTSFGAQLDMGIGSYRHSDVSAAAGLHLFWRDPESGLLGIYGDWGYLSPRHAGRMGAEASAYNGRWSLDAVAGVAFGQDVLTQFFDELDLSYYFTDNFRGSIGHRLITRGNVANVSFEYMFDSIPGWSVYGEAETGEDDYHAAWLGLRYSMQDPSKSLIQRNRQGDAPIRIPRNLASISRCGDIDGAENYHKSWNGFKTEYTSEICGSKDDLNEYDAKEY